MEIHCGGLHQSNIFKFEEAKRPATMINAREMETDQMIELRTLEWKIKSPFERRMFYILFGAGLASSIGDL